MTITHNLFYEMTVNAIVKLVTSVYWTVISLTVHVTQ